MPTIKCENCGNAIGNDALYDEHFDTYFCDSECFSECFAENTDYKEYYARLNIIEVDL